MALVRAVNFLCCIKAIYLRHPISKDKKSWFFLCCLCFHISSPPNILLLTRIRCCGARRALAFCGNSIMDVRKLGGCFILKHICLEHASTSSTAKSLWFDGCLIITRFNNFHSITKLTFHDSRQQIIFAIKTTNSATKMYNAKNLRNCFIKSAFQSLTFIS